MAADYLMAGQHSELERLQLQSRVWEPAGRVLVERLPSGSGLRVIDVGCGAMGWLGVLSGWVGPSGTVVGTDINRDLLAAAGAFVAEGAMANVELVEDDLFASALPSETFDLVHARFQLAPIGRVAEQLASYRRLVRPGGWLVLEDPDAASWHFNPPAPAAERLIGLILDAFRAGGWRFRCRPRAPGPPRRSGHRASAGRPRARPAAGPPVPAASPPVRRVAGRTDRAGHRPGGLRVTPGPGRGGAR